MASGILSIQTSLDGCRDWLSGGWFVFWTRNAKWLSSQCRYNVEIKLEYSECNHEISNVEFCKRYYFTLLRETIEKGNRDVKRPTKTRNWMQNQSTTQNGAT
mmetsp:Transcript_8898/g.15594  ORF Transcript_8898/g.15594 Transcript_8898/m.15594 type:complete len:102 (-) Transcript_8898:306-611(-)